jgi:DNA-dependent RNA polymerase auxiliary subunit epsilon
MYLLDEYLCRLKTGKKTEFVISANEIAQKRNMTWRTVTNSLNELQTMQLISMNDKVCLVNINKYTSLIQAFHALTKTTDKKQFITLLHTGDYVNLQRFGYVECYDGNEQLLTQEGVMLNSRTSAKIHNSEEEQLCQKAEGSAKKHNLMSNSITLCQIAQPYAKKQKVLLKSISILEEIRQKVQENYTKVDFIDEFRDEFLEFFSEEEFGNLVYIIFEENELENVIFGPELLVFLCSGVLSFSRRGFCHLAEGVMLNSRTVNKEININKKLTSKAGIYREEEESKEDIFELDKTSLEQSISGYQQTKRKQLFPFFPANEVEEYISDIRNCLDRPDKIYINQVWEIAHECFDQEAITDEDGKEILPADTNLENVGIARERLMKDILLPAFDQTQAIIEAGIVTINGEDFTVTATIDNPDDFSNIIDWELVTILDGDNYVISTKRVRNIYGEQVEQLPPRSVKRDNRGDDMSYMQKIVLIGDDDTRYSQLTPVELVIYNFLNENFKIGELGEVDEPKHAFINRTTLAAFYVDAKDKGVTESDFLSVLSKDKPDGTGSLNLRQRMFSADKIRKWNRLHTLSSIVDEFEINHE